MQKILAIAWKDTLLRFSSKSEWLFFLLLPIVFTMILASGTGGSSDGRVLLVVVDQANSPLSAELVGVLKQSAAVRIDEMVLPAADDQFSKRQISAELVIPANFDIQHLQQGSIALELRQQPNNMDALVASRAVTAVISRVSSSVDIANRSVAAAESLKPFVSSAGRQTYFNAALLEAQSEMSTAPVRIAVTQGATQNPVQYDPRTNSSAGQLITWVFIPLIGISAMFAFERQKGTLRRLLTTPTRKSTYLLGTILGQVVSALVQMLLLVIFGILVMGLNWGHEPAALALVLVVSTLAAAALGITLGTFVKTEGQANGLSMALGMVMALMGGCWYPIELFPQIVRTVVKVLPTTWAMQGLLDIALRGQGLLQVLSTAGVLLVFAALFFSIGVWRFRYE